MQRSGVMIVPWVYTRLAKKQEVGRLKILRCPANHTVTQSLLAKKVVADRLKILHCSYSTALDQSTLQSIAKRYSYIKQHTKVSGMSKYKDISAIDISGIYNAGWGGGGKGGGLVITLVGHCERLHFNPKQPSERKRSLGASTNVCVAVTVGGWAQS